VRASVDEAHLPEVRARADHDAPVAVRARCDAVDDDHELPDARSLAGEGASTRDVEGVRGAGEPLDLTLAASPEEPEIRDLLLLDPHVSLLVRPMPEP
jgi:hypothetical protein